MMLEGAVPSSTARRNRRPFPPACRSHLQAARRSHPARSRWLRAAGSCRHVPYRSCSELVSLGFVVSGLSSGQIGEVGSLGRWRKPSKTRVMSSGGGCGDCGRRLDSGRRWTLGCSTWPYPLRQYQGGAVRSAPRWPGLSSAACPRPPHCAQPPADADRAYPGGFALATPAGHATVTGNQPADQHHGRGYRGEHRQFPAVHGVGGASGGRSG